MRSNTQEQPRSPWWSQPIVHWQANQVVITFHSTLDRSEGAEKVIASLRLNTLHEFLSTQGFQLRSFTTKDVPHHDNPSCPELELLELEVEFLELEIAALEWGARRDPAFSDLSTASYQRYKTPIDREIEELETRVEVLLREIEQCERKTYEHSDTTTENERPVQEPPKRGLNSPVGKYLFTPASGHGTLVMCFFHSSSPALAHSSSLHNNRQASTTTTDTTQSIVKLINQNVDKITHDAQSPLVAATPNWISGGAPGIGSACPASVPIPVPSDKPHTNWHYTLPELSENLINLKGDGVTVFVLDTLPRVEDVRNVVQHDGAENVLLQSVVRAIDSVPPKIIIHRPLLLPINLRDIQTGKDVYGQHFGFKMPDHGLFVTGIIHDLVPNATIECIRILNDSGVGDLLMIIDALYEIQERMMQGEFEHVVVNLSMIIGAPDAMLPSLWLADEHVSADTLAPMIQQLDALVAGFHMVVQSLVAQGAVIVASAGNESDANNYHDISGTGGQRFKPRYPAAFPEVISVGAVDKDGRATSYSDYPSLPNNHNGVATYGGTLPRPVPPHPNPSVKTTAIVDDAVVGLYCSSQYPALSASNTPPNEYDAPSPDYGWAYWSGTSFATPIVSSLAAILLHGVQTGRVSSVTSIPSLITLANGQQQLTLTGVAFSNNTGFGNNVGLLRAMQTGS